MKVSGEEAKKWKAVRLDTLADIDANLIEADDATGKVVFLDRTGAQVVYESGPHTIKLVRK